VFVLKHLRRVKVRTNISRAGYIYGFLSKLFKPLMFVYLYSKFRYTI